MNAVPEPAGVTLKERDVAPEFSLLDQHSQSQRLLDYRGRSVLLYFYPEDDTSG